MRAQSAVCMFVSAVLVAVLGIPAIAGAAPHSPAGSSWHYNKGLPQNVPLPDWAKGKRIYFLPMPDAETGQPAESKNLGNKSAGHKHSPPPGDFANGATRCENFYCPHPPLSYLSENHGVQHSPHVYPVFWGSNWNKAPGSEVKAEIMTFLNGLSGSTYQNILTQYFDASGRIAPTVQVAAPFIDESVSAPSGLTPTSEVIAQEANVAIQQIEKGNPGWTPGHDDQFIVMPAPGTVYSPGNPGYCAYHSQVGPAATAFVPYMGDSPFTACKAAAEGNASRATTFGVSHEYAEAATNPLTGPGYSVWTTLDPAHYEIADICTFQAYPLPNGVWVSQLWDNDQNDCVSGNANPAQVFAEAGQPTNVGIDEATLNASVYPEGLETEYRFEYGLTSSYGQFALTSKLKAGGTVDSMSPVSATITGLEPEHTYHYRLRVINATGTFYTGDRTLTTSHWTMPSEVHNLLKDIACAAAENCVAVGGEGGLIAAERWDGSKWSEMTVPGPEKLEVLKAHAVSCSAASACTAVIAAETPNTVPASLIWNGTSWTRVAVPLPGDAAKSGATLRDISCFSSTYCIAVGSYPVQSANPPLTKTLVEKFDGTTWTVQTSPNVAAKNFNRLEAVSCSGTQQCMAVGYVQKGANEGEKEVLVEGWDGTSWTLRTTPAPPETGSLLTGVSCRNSSLCMVLGKTGSGAGFTASWDGTAWHSQLTGLSSNNWDLSCGAMNSCDVIGSATTEGAPAGVGWHWTGEEWIPEAPAAPPTGGGFEMSKISCVPGGPCVTLGSATSGSFSFSESMATWWTTPTFRFAFGSKGSGAGQFTGPTGVAVDSGGNVWVLDSGNSRVEKFNSKGEYLCQGAVLGAPTAIAADPAGNVWLAATAQVEKIGSTCNHLTQFGEPGSGNGQFKGPQGIAVDPLGYIWVADSKNYRIQKFNSKGEYLTQCGSQGSGNGQFGGGAQAIAADFESNIWVSDNFNNRIEEFNTTCGFLGKFDKASSESPIWTTPIAMTADELGNLWVPTLAEGRVLGFFREGAYRTKFGAHGSGPGQFGTVSGIAAAPNGVIWLVDTTNNRVEKWVGFERQVETGRSKGLTATGGTLTGRINPEGSATSYHFEYGTTTAYGANAPTSDSVTGSGLTRVTVLATAGGLTSGTTYHYRLVATKSNGQKIYGGDRRFTTP